jgi:hypothetical protein
MTTKFPRFQRAITSALVAGAVGASLWLAPTDACAQEADDPSVSPTGKGIAGGVLLGAEIVMIPIAIAGVQEWWPYVVFGAVGAGAGAAGGWAIETQVTASEPSLYMLAGGMALVVPTIVAVLNATAYDPTDEDEEDGPDADGPPGEVEAGVEVGARYPGGAPVPMSLVGVDAWSKRSSVALGVPAVAVGPRFTAAEVSTYGVRQATEVAVPVISGSF